MWPKPSPDQVLSAGVCTQSANYTSWNFSVLDIGRLHSVYRKIDIDGSNSIELAVSELLAFLDLDRTRFTKRIFTMFDEDSSGLLDFNESALSLWNYCTLF